MLLPETLRCQPPWLVVIEALALVGLIGWFDHLTELWRDGEYKEEGIAIAPTRVQKIRMSRNPFAHGEV